MVICVKCWTQSLAHSKVLIDINYIFTNEYKLLWFFMQLMLRNPGARVYPYSLNLSADGITLLFRWFDRYHVNPSTFWCAVSSR